MSFNRIFLKFASILWLTVYCTSGAQAIPPEQNLEDRQSSKRTADGLSKKAQPDQANLPAETLGVKAVPDEVFWRDVIAVATEAEKNPRLQKRQKTSENEDDWWAAVIASEPKPQNTGLSMTASPLSSSPPFPIPVKSSSPSASSQSQEQYIGTCFERILGYEEHMDELVFLINSSKKKLEIFSWTLGYLDEDVFYALRGACDRGVSTILTVREIANELTEDTLEEMGVQINLGRKTHTKCVMVDSHTAMIGSYNFLGASNDGNYEWRGVMKESSFRVSGNSDLVGRLRGRIYCDMIRYEREEPPLLNPLCVELPDNSRFSLLTNLSHHQDFFKCMAQLAREKVIIYSPFVNYRNAISQFKILERWMRSTVPLVVHVLPDHAEKLKWALSKCQKLKERTTIKTSDFHRKSLIVDPQSFDNCYFCDGSLNWFSAATDIKSEECNQETSVVLSGPIIRDHLDVDDI